MSAVVRRGLDVQRSGGGSALHVELAGDHVGNYPRAELAEKTDLALGGVLAATKAGYMEVDVLYDSPLFVERWKSHRPRGGALEVDPLARGTGRKNCRRSCCRGSELEGGEPRFDPILIQAKPEAVRLHHRGAQVFWRHTRTACRVVPVAQSRYQEVAREYRVVAERRVVAM